MRRAIIALSFVFASTLAAVPAAADEYVCRTNYAGQGLTPEQIEQFCQDEADGGGPDFPGRSGDGEVFDPGCTRMGGRLQECEFHPR